MRCPHCGQQHLDKSSFCPVTGKPIPKALTCPNCGQAVQDDWTHCASCGQLLRKYKRTPSGLRVVYWSFILVVIGLVALGVYWLLSLQLPASSLAPTPGHLPSATVLSTSQPATALPQEATALVAAVPTETATSVPPTELPLATLPPPLAAVEFPTQVIDYPSGWPAQLHYPEQFKLVEAASGELPGGGSPGWAAKLRYKGTPDSAADLLSSFFTSGGWQITDRMELDSGGFLILIERDNKTGTGIVVIDPDPTERSYSRVVAIVFPERPGQ